MIRLVNPISGGETWVHESRLDEYLARGFQFAAPPMPVPPMPAPPAETPGQKPTPKKTTRKAR